MEPAGSPRVLLVYADRVGASMGGVGIRAVELARVLRDALGAQTTIAAAEHDGGDAGAPVVTFAPHAPRALAPHLAGADVVIAQPAWPLTMRRFARSGARLVFDLYDPEAFGTLEHFAGRRRRALMSRFAVDRLVGALRLADHVMCANERQRDLWLGALLAAGLVTPERYDADPTLRSLLDVVAYGVPAAPPPDVTAAAPRAALGIAPDDEVVLWNGGIWSWLDAPTAIRAIACLRARRPRARLVFMGASSAEPARRAAAEARALADELGLLADGGVVFHDAWVPYEQRAAWLLDANCAISTHVDHLETRFSSRTRLLDCFWAGLPVVCTRGDELATRVERDELGAAVPSQDPDAAAAALDRVLERGRAAYAERLAAAARELTWPAVTAPLVRWLREPPLVPRAGAAVERGLGERMRTAAYVAGAGALSSLRMRAPRLR